MGVLLYDADRMEEAMKAPERSLVESHRSVLLDPHDPEVIRGAEENGISPKMVEAAQNSPVYKYVMDWKIALPLHPEFRTMPMLYYVPPLMPVSGRTGDGIYQQKAHDFFAHLDNSRLPMKYLSRLFTAGNMDIIRETMMRQMAVRYLKRSQELDDVDEAEAMNVLRHAGLTVDQAEAIYRLTALSDLNERYVMPPIQREEAIEDSGCPPEYCKGSCGLGCSSAPERGM